MAEAEELPSYEETLSRGAAEQKALLTEQIGEEKGQAAADVAELQRLQREQRPEYERFKQKQMDVERMAPPPVLEKPPPAPRTQEMIQPSSLERSVGMASIFALLSVGMAKGSAIYGLKALGGFLTGAHAGNLEQADASIKDFNSEMKRVHDANEYSRQQYLDVFNNKKYTLEMQEHAVHLKALEMKDELMVQARREKGMAGVHDLIRQRADVDHKFGAEMQRYRQWEETIRHHKAMEAKGGAAGGGLDTILGIPIADIPPTPPGERYNEAFLKMLPPVQADIVKRVANGQIDLKTYGGMGKTASEARINYGNAAGVYDSNFKTRLAGILEKAEKELTPGGIVGNNAMAINTLPHHVDQYMTALGQLNNSQLQRWNSSKNKFQTEFGDPKLGNVKVSAHVVAEELARVAKGGRASPIKEEVERMLEVFNTSDSPQQAFGKAWEVLQVAGGRLSAMEETYRNQGIEKSILTPEAAELIKKYKPKNKPMPDWLKNRERGASRRPEDLRDLEKRAEPSQQRLNTIGERARQGLPNFGKDKNGRPYHWDETLGKMVYD